MKRLSILAVVLTFVAAPSLAEPLPDGTYRGIGAGNVEMIIKGRSAQFRTSADRCSGRVSGGFKDDGPGNWLFTASEALMDSYCTISITRQPAGSMVVEELSNCIYWHGASCGFSGTVSR